MSGWGTCRRCRARIWWGTSPFNSAKAFPFDDDEEQQSHFKTCAAQEWVTDYAGNRYQVNTCKACGAKVWWQTTAKGKRRPMDVESDHASYECHFDTCMGQPAGASAASTNGYVPPPQTAADPRDAIHMWLADLGLTWPSTMSQITSAFRGLAMTHHPDMGGQAADFIRIRLAYDRLRELMGALA